MMQDEPLLDWEDFDEDEDEEHQVLLRVSF